MRRAWCRALHTACERQSCIRGTVRQCTAYPVSIVRLCCRRGTPGPQRSGMQPAASRSSALGVWYPTPGPHLRRGWCTEATLTPCRASRARPAGVFSVSARRSRLKTTQTSRRRRVPAAQPPMRALQIVCCDRFSTERACSAGGTRTQRTHAPTRHGHTTTRTHDPHARAHSHRDMGRAPRRRRRLSGRCGDRDRSHRFPLYDDFDHRHRCAQSRYRWTAADDGEGGGFSIATAMILRTDAGRRRWSSFAAIFRTLISHYPYACCD